MQRTLTITAIALLTLLGVSCGDDFLERQNPNQVSLDNFYETADDVTAAVNGAYTSLHNRELYKRQIYALEYLSGDFAITQGGFQYANLIGFNFSAVEDNLVNSTWNGSYTGIARANAVINEAPDATIAEALKKRLIAEARFLRAVYYFHLVTFYGGVPIVEAQISGVNDAGLKPARSTEEEVWAFIEQDLTVALQDLPLREDYSDAEVGRATRGAAAGFLGKAHLYQQKYEAARDIFARLIASEFGTYDLVANYEDNFTDVNENNEESVFEIQFSDLGGGVWAGDDSGQGSETTYLGTEFGPKHFGNSYPSDEVNAFFDAHPEDSIRRVYTIARPGDQWGSWDTVQVSQWNARIPNAGGNSAWRKWNLGNDEVRLKSQSNYRLMRFADVLLMFAEAENEVNGPTAAAYDAINRVRARAMVPPLPAGLSADEFFRALQDERRLEMTFELTRYFDLVRWGEGEQMSGFDPARNRYFPLPQNELDLNPNLEQNPNW